MCGLIDYKKSVDGILFVCNLLIRDFSNHRGLFVFKRIIFFLFLNASVPLFAHVYPMFSKAQEEAKKTTSWEYPHQEIVHYMQKEGKQSLLIFSYGSLMDAASAACSLSQASMATRRPAIAFGVRRLFDRDVPVREDSKWGTPTDPKARGMLNIMLSEQPEDFINGVLMDVTIEDISHILFREEGYDLLPVVVQDWDNVADTLHPCYQIAYAFYAPQNSNATNSLILPRPGYYELSRNASLFYGQIFYRIWLKTTFLADGVTPITEWERKTLNENEEINFTCPR